MSIGRTACTTEARAPAAGVGLLLDEGWKVASEQGDGACSGDEYRQFDFWIGDWEVFDDDGARQGTNRIEPILDWCALQESWVGAGGSVGHSLNTFDRQTGRWHQTWVDNSGLLLQLDGAFDGTSMVLSGPGENRDGEPITHRITWTPLEDGRVRQHWEVSADGDSWNDVFVGLYTRTE